MKILVSLPLNFKNENLSDFLKSIDNLKKLGHDITLDTEIKAQTDKTKDPTLNFFKRIEKEIKFTDIVITEVTYADTKVGFEIARALNEKKIVIALEQEGKLEAEIPSIHGNKLTSLIKKTYTPSNVISVVEKSVDEAKSKLDTKFILIISSEIDRYLDWASGEKRMHKAQIVRNAVEEVLKKDPDYKKYLTS